MDSASLPSLTNWLDGIDRWIELAPLLPVLVALEIILSADNAVALAAITKKLKSQDLQRKALNLGILIALVFRIFLILLAQKILKYWPFTLLASFYLLWLSIDKFFIDQSNNKQKTDVNPDTEFSFWKIVILLSFTDIAFSIDSVATAVAISDQFLLVITGGIIGVIALRFTSGLFIKWLQIYPKLESAGYVAVAFVGIKLLIGVIFNSLDIPEWIMPSIVLLLFVWGFSTKNIGDFQ